VLPRRSRRVCHDLRFARAVPKVADWRRRGHDPLPVAIARASRSRPTRSRCTTCARSAAEGRVAIGYPLQRPTLGGDWAVGRGQRLLARGAAARGAPPFARRVAARRLRGRRLALRLHRLRFAIVSGGLALHRGAMMQRPRSSVPWCTVEATVQKECDARTAGCGLTREPWRAELVAATARPRVRHPALRAQSAQRQDAGGRCACRTITIGISRRQRRRRDPGDASGMGPIRSVDPPRLKSSGSRGRSRATPRQVTPAVLTAPGSEHACTERHGSTAPA
jgi:hypothetical protein